MSWVAFLCTSVYRSRCPASSLSLARGYSAHPVPCLATCCTQMRCPLGEHKTACETNIWRRFPTVSPGSRPISVSFFCRTLPLCPALRTSLIIPPREPRQAPSPTSHRTTGMLLARSSTVFRTHKGMRVLLWPPIHAGRQSDHTFLSTVPFMTGGSQSQPSSKPADQSECLHSFGKRPQGSWTSVYQNSPASASLACSMISENESRGLPHAVRRASLGQPTITTPSFFSLHITPPLNMKTRSPKQPLPPSRISPHTNR
ncbi:hypothetical protein VTK26DRAFT_2929 [Humicola hyalothermophila]